MLVSGNSMENILARAKHAKLRALAQLVNKYGSIGALAMAGTATNITPAQVIGVITNAVINERTLRAAIEAASDLATLQAIDVTSGWPSNP
jgi:hypothetical protein